VYLEGKLGNQHLQPGIVTLELLYFSPGSIPGDIPGEPLFACFHEIFQPGIVRARLDTFAVTEVPDGGVTPKPFQYDAYFLLGGELAAGDVLDIPDKLLCFLCPGFSLPDPVNFLGHLPAPFQSLLYCFLGAGATP
jgi:hypothetical protein